MPTSQIGYSYRRIDEAGTPFGVTIDSQTLEDQTVTRRERDSIQQTSVSLDKVADFVVEKMDGFVRE